MHREIRKHIEDMLEGDGPESTAIQQDVRQHLAQCEECRAQVDAMRQHATLLRELRPPDEVVLEPRAGFYARVMERIEAEGPISIWNLFIESAFGRRIAVASMALAVLLGIYLITSERSADEAVIAVQQDQFVSSEPSLPASLAIVGATAGAIPGEDAPGRVLMQAQQLPGQQFNDAESDDDDILVNLVTYQDQ